MTHFKLLVMVAPNVHSPDYPSNYPNHHCKICIAIWLGWVQPLPNQPFPRFSDESKLLLPFFWEWTSVNFSYYIYYLMWTAGYCTSFVTSNIPKYVTLDHRFSGSNSQFCLAVIPIDIPNYTKNRLSIWRCNWSTLINVNLEMRKNPFIRMNSQDLP